MANVKISYNKKFIVIKDLKKCSRLGMIRGLMFRVRENSYALLFQFSKPINMKIHSFFVFFPFLAIWLDENSNVLAKKIVKPFTFSVGINKKFLKLIEIPINKRYSEVINQLS